MGGHYKKVINTQPQATTPYQPTNPSGQGLNRAMLCHITNVILANMFEPFKSSNSGMRGPNCHQTTLK